MASAVGYLSSEITNLLPGKDRYPPTCELSSEVPHTKDYGPSYPWISNTRPPHHGSSPSTTTDSPPSPRVQSSPHHGPAPLQSPVRRRTRLPALPPTSALHLKYERDAKHLRSKLSLQLATDVRSLYEKSLFVDLKFEASRGNVYCHSALVAARSPLLWKIIGEIHHLQDTGAAKLSTSAISSVSLRDIDYYPLEKFIRSLYTNKVEADAQLKEQLEETLVSLQQQALVSKKLHIVRLDSEEEEQVQKCILEQLKHGNFLPDAIKIRDVEHREKTGNVYRQGVEKCGINHGKSSTVTDEDSLSGETVLTLKTGESSVSGISSSDSGPARSLVVRPGTGTKQCTSVVNTQKAQQSKVAQCDISMSLNHRVKCGKSQEGQSVEERDNYVNENMNNTQSTQAAAAATDEVFVSQDSGRTQRGKLKLTATTPTSRRSISDDLSPNSQLSTQESPVFNVCMIKELQTSPMQVSATPYQDKQRNEAPSSSSKSSIPEMMSMERCAQGEQERQNKTVLQQIESQLHALPKCRLTERQRSLDSVTRDESGYSSISKRGNRERDRGGGGGGAVKPGVQRKSHSFTIDTRQDDRDGSDVGDDEDMRLNCMHETSSLEVEIPSSHEGDVNSSGHDSGQSEQNEEEEEDEGFKRDDECFDGEEDRESHKETKENMDEDNDSLMPTRPLVRARTYEVFDSLLEENAKDKASEEGTNKKEESDEGNDPEVIREMERKKGSLLFEHSLQTYSNVPTTNLMTASMSSEGSVGVPSLYGSVIENTMMSSVHSLAPIETVAVAVPVAVPVPVPVPVVMPAHESQGQDKSLMQPVLPPKTCMLRRPLTVQKSTEEMALELQQEIAKRGPDTRSPSPDSLSVDLPAVTQEERTTTTWKKLDEAAKASVMESSTNKEELNDEEKEKDDRENDSKSSDSTEVGTVSQHKVEEGTIEPTAELSSSVHDSPRLKWRAENVPIISGGSTLKKEKEEPESVIAFERQVSSTSVKDVDSIPLVCGYVGPQEEADKKGQKEKMEGGKQDETMTEGEGSQPQSMFSMFIDFKDIPSPQKEQVEEQMKKENMKSKSQSSSVYMYIEADTPSPKLRRKRKSESEGTDSRGTPTGVRETSGIRQLIKSPTTDSGTGNDDDITPKDENENPETPDTQVEMSNKERKGFFMFIEADATPTKSGSPKPRRRLLMSTCRNRKQQEQEEGNKVMSRSAPSDSVLFGNQENTAMTKSVIDREEFIAQQPTKRNVSLNDKINESSSAKEFVSGIPRPIYLLKSKPRTVRGESRREGRRGEKRESSLTRKVEEKPEVVNEPTANNEMTTSHEVSELGTSLSVSLTEMMSSSSNLPDHEDSELSDVSSLLSSLERSNNDSSKGSGGETQGQLGEDLLKMFLHEINTDVSIQVGEKKVRAHKCILASRCAYFAAMLSGHWVESAGNVIKLQGFSLECVMVALRHIYSGSSTVPDGVKVAELAALADMLGLDGLKDVIALHLKAKLCHYFHKPCSGCLEGVIDVLPVAGAYCLDELYLKCLRWIARYFVVILPSRGFAALPPELQDRCLKQLLDDMSVSTVIDTVLGCERVLSSLPLVRWAQPVFDITAQLMEAATSFIAANLSAVLASDRFIAVGKGSGWSLENLEDTMKVACDLVRPDQAVLAHIQLTKLLQMDHEDGVPEFSEGFLGFVEKLLNQVEKFMIHNANRVAVCRKWPLLSTETQRRIKDAALIVVEFSKPTAPKPRLASGHKMVARSTMGNAFTKGRPDSTRLSRSASTTAVPPSHRTRSGSRGPVGRERSETPPASITRTITPQPSYPTPPPTRASTLRAQARCATVQRSQSARTVMERPRKMRHGNDTSTDEESHSSGRRPPSAASWSATRGATFTRPSSRAQQQQPSSNKVPSRPHTPGPEGRDPLRWRPGAQRTGRQTASSASEEELPLRRSSTTGRMVNPASPTTAKVARTQSSDVRCQTPTRRPDVRTPGQTPVRKPRHPDAARHMESGSRTPPAKGDSRTVDVRNGNLLGKGRVAVPGRRAARSPLREPRTGGSPVVTPPSRASTTSQHNSRSTSTSSRASQASASEPRPTVGSRSNTFCKDDPSPSTPKLAATTAP